MNLEDLVFDSEGRVFTAGRAVVVELTNPITRDRVRLDPPYEVAEGELERLDAVFNDYCLLAWENGSDNPANKYRVSPAVVDPYRLLEGSMPLPDLHQQLRDLVAGFGFWAVDGALGSVAAGGDAVTGELASQAGRVRGRRRLAALGLEPADAQAALEAQRALYEAERARYILLAQGGLHMASSHALYGMLVEAIKDANGWDRLPPDWPGEQLAWPQE